MFYFLLPSIVTYNFILVAAAVIPALVLMIKVYRADRLEKEDPALLWSLVKAGIFSSLIAMLSERILSELLGAAVGDGGVYQFLLYFGVVAFSEEGAKYLMLRRRTWSIPDFDCQYDGVVFAVFVSLGFAVWENISYVMHYGLSTAILRALTAIPGHTCFGVFMGVFYGIAKKAAVRETEEKARMYRILAVVVPALLHGAYDYIASTDTGSWLFIAFIAVLFAASYALVVKTSREDQYL